MPRNKIKDDDLDFEIFVDPSCLSEPAEDTEPSADTTTDITAQPSMATEQPPDAVLPDSDSVEETATVTVEDIDVPQEEKVEDAVENKEEEVTPAAQPDDSIVDEEQQEDVSAEPTEEPSQEPTEEPSQEPTEEPSQEPVVAEEVDSAPSVDDQDQPTPEAEPEHKEEEQVEAEAEVDNETQEEPSPPEEASIVEPEVAAEPQEAHKEEQPTQDLVDEVQQESQSEDREGSLQQEEPHLDDEVDQAEEQDEHVEEAAPTEAHDQDEATEDAIRSVSSQGFTDRKTSLRTEALIQAAARAVVAKLERRKASGDSIQPEDEPEDVEHSILSTATEEGDTLLQEDYEEPTRRRQSTNSTGSQLHHDVPSGPASCDEGGESSSHNEPESDDVFSDRSARSSIASFDNPPADEEDPTIKSPALQQDIDQSDRHSVRSSNTHTRSPRVSGVSMISDLSQYDKEDFVPTSREARLPFRTPSAIRNIQMSSPTPSVIHGVSPRSSKRQHNSNGGMLPTISRLGSPTVTTQFSPKGRSTPTRLKTRREAPLVLLHVTVLPLRWMWGDILNCLDALNGKTYGENKEVFEASEQLKSLRDSWRELQDHVSDTVLERGVLMPHPQDDFEILEERFLESLELPLRRRARILECGHYLGPANEFGPDDDEFEENEDDYASQSGEQREERRHWCNTCRNEIKYEDLGPGKVFRVKVYASNGLMRAGAWEACWKEMERVDVEVEPIVEMSVQNELEKLVVINTELEEQRQREIEQAEAEAAAAVAAAQVAQEEEARLAVLAQSRPQSVAANAMVVQESGFTEEQALPASRSLMDTPTQDQQARSSAMISSPGSSSMQMMGIHASPPQPPSTMATARFASPSPQPIQSSPLRHAILPPDDPVPEQAQYQQDMYADTTPQPLPIEQAVHPDTTSSMYAHHPTSPSLAISSRNPESYPTSTRSPSEEVYERRHRRTSSSRGRSAHSRHSQKYEGTAREGRNLNLENASFIELFLEAFKVLLRDPKNVAIIVLCLFVMAILARPSSTPSGQNGLQLVQTRGDGNGNEQVQGYTPRYEPKVAAEVVAPVVPVVQGSVSVVTTEMATASVLVVTTTVTSASAEASLEIEGPVIEQEAAGLESEDATQPEQVVEAAAEETAQEIITENSALEGVEEPVAEYALNVEESPDAVTDESSDATGVLLTEEEEQVNIRGTDQTDASIPILDKINGDVASLDTTDATDLPQLTEEEEPASTIAPVEEPEPILVQEQDVLVGLQSIETSATSTSEHIAATEAATTSASAAQADTTTGTEAKDPCHSIISQKTTLRIIETVTETVTVSALPSATATSSEAEATSDSESTAETKSETSTSTSMTTDEVATASASVATSSASASVSESPSVSTFVPESVSAMTETTTATPSLTTVQETVYETETETVRVTVSVGGSGSGRKHDEL